MTRVLSELLQAREPHFRIALKQLEQAAGAPSEDIRLTSELSLQAKDKVRELNLDPRDTTAQELYQALAVRVRRDNATLATLLGAGQDDANLMPRIERLINHLDVPKQVFALKNACARKMLRLNPPKKVMKQLGYRSLDSMLKHELPCALLGAGMLAESATWQKNLLAAYRRLSPGDFESREATITAPAHERWEKFAQPYVAQHQHNIVTVTVMGSVLLLPMGNHLVEGAPFMSTLLALQAVQDMRSASAYLKLQQVRPDFGALVAHVSQAEPMSEARLLKMPLPWKLVHTFFGRTPQAYRAELFEPHVVPADLRYEPLGHSLARVHPTFEFWQGTTHLGLHHKRGAVSFHPIDAALNVINHLPFEQRIAKHLRTHLWQELLLRYMRQDNLMGNLQQQLSDELVGQPALV